jgi:hypothetical protein
LKPNAMQFSVLAIVSQMILPAKAAQSDSSS